MTRRPPRSRLRILGVATALAALGLVVLAGSASADSGLRPIFPDPVSPNGRNIFNLYVGISPVAIAVFLVVEILLLVAILKFRRSKRPPGFIPPQFHGSTILEVVWTLIPLVIVLVIAGVSMVELTNDFQASADTFKYDEEITVTGYQFGWQYDYRNSGVTLKVDGVSTGEVAPLVVPTGKTVRLRFQGRDVIHSWWVPAISGKTDAVPGYANYSWLKIDQAGSWRGECAELCGAGHSTMQIIVQAVDQAAFDQWVAKQKAAASQPSPSPSPSPSR